MQGRVRMKGFVATTDFEWYTFLAAEPALEEVNFWQPSGKRNFGAVPSGSPYFFKLKRPHYAIAGFGIFSRAQILPDWLAWECFGRGNGAPDLATFRTLLAVYRRSTGNPAERVPRVGCHIVSQPMFFPRDLWIDQPRDWSRNIVQGKGYDLRGGEGRRILLECQQRAAFLISQSGATAGASRALETVNAYGEGLPARVRLGQGTFRLAVQDAYQSACAVTGEHSLPALEAAHIRPYSLELRHEVTNGLLLRGDLHKLFDRGYVTVDADGIFHVSPRLREDYQNGRCYYPLDKQRIRLPEREGERPDRDKLAWHAAQVFVA